MPRDYKNAGGRKNGGPGARVLAALAFLSGLSIGLLVAFAVYLRFHVAGAPVAVATGPSPAIAGTDTQGAAAKPAAAPGLTFDFYKILPSREVNVSEWVTEDRPATAPPAAGPSDATAAAPAAAPGETYLFQVGSFKTEEAADQTRARLALLGIAADVQRVVISGQDAILRVRIGPFSDPAKFEDMRRKLSDNGIDFMVLKLKVDGAQSGEG